MHDTNHGVLINFYQKNNETQDSFRAHQLPNGPISLTPSSPNKQMRQKRMSLNVQNQQPVDLFKSH